MKEIKIKIHNSQEMIKLGMLLGKESYPNLVIGLNGDLGAGKTVLTKGIGLSLGVKKVINSPTFTIMKIYDTTNPTIKKLYHLDVYRLSNSQSDFDLEEYFYLDGLVVIEWSKIIQDLLPEDCWNITITNLSSGDENRDAFVSGDENRNAFVSGDVLDTSRIVHIQYHHVDLEQRLREDNYEIIY